MSRPFPYNNNYFRKDSNPIMVRKSVVLLHQHNLSKNTSGLRHVKHLMYFMERQGAGRDLDDPKVLTAGNTEATKSAGRGSASHTSKEEDPRPSNSGYGKSLVPWRVLSNK